MDFNTVISKYKVSEYKELSQKPDSGVYLMSRGEEDCFVLRIYSHEMPVYEMLKNKDTRDSHRFTTAGGRMNSLWLRNSLLTVFLFRK